jgi:hypothetical protein
VRLQAQAKPRDGYLEESVTLTGSSPITVAQGLAGLEQLKGQLNKKQLAERQESFSRAERFIRSGPQSGGLSPPGKSFEVKDTTIRVDVEILRGTNFVN